MTTVITAMTVPATAAEFSTDFFLSLVYIGRDMHKILGWFAWADTDKCLHNSGSGFQAFDSAAW